jgi:hypothetical protein
MRGQRIITDMKTGDLKPYLAQIKALPFAADVRVERNTPARDETADAVVHLRTETGTIPLQVKVKERPLQKATIEGLLAHDRPKGNVLVLAPYVPADLGEQLARHHLNYLDLAGNCHLEIGRRYLVHVEGKRPPKAEGRGRGLGATGYQVVFALLADRTLVQAPVRRIAEAAGVPKTVVGDLLVRLREDGTLGRTRQGRVLLRPAALLERWLTGYGDLLRPRLLVHRYRVADPNPIHLEKRIAQAFGARTRWVWGGAAAAYRLTKHYRGEETLVHADDLPPDLPTQVRAMPAKDGQLTILRAPGPLAFTGPAPHVAHPLLIYAELLLQGRDRERETAAEVRTRYLEGL